jgi:Glycosyltransferase family 87
MSRGVRASLVPAFVALAGAALLGGLGLLSPAFSDYEQEAETAVKALRAGDLAGFLADAPAYGGSLVLRAPFALLPNLWGGGDLAAFRAVAAPCLLAGVVLGVWLWSRAAALGHGGLGRWLALALCAVNPLTLRALEVGHPEELLGGVLAVGAVLAAGARRPLVAGLLLGAAVANKPWAVLAGLPVLLALHTTRDRATATATSLALAAAITAPFVLAGSAAVAQASAVATAPSTIFQPWQLWWFFGTHGDVVMGLYSAKPGFRTPPEWIAHVGRLVVAAVPLAVSLFAARRWRGRPWHDALALLALAFLLRCLIDPWNVVYYELPFLLALVAWEVHARREPPVVSLAATLLAWITLTGTGSMSPDVQAAAFLAWSLPLAGFLGARVLRAPAPRYSATEAIASTARAY